MANENRPAEAQAEYEAYLKSFGDNYIGKSKKAGWWNEYDKKQTQATNINSYNTNPLGGFQLSSDSAENQRQTENLSQVGAMTGENIQSIGQDNQSYKAKLMARVNGSDPVAQYMMGQRNRNMANVGRSIAGKGVAGGVAASSMNQAQQSADSDINAQMYKNDRTNQQDMFSYIKRNQKLTGGALSQGQDMGLADQISTEAGQGVFGTVICTELHRQGLLTNEQYGKDAHFGWALQVADPYAFIGYYAWAQHVVPLMQRSLTLTQLISKLALPWARQISGEKNLIGSIVLNLGLPVCRLIGTVITLNRKPTHA